MRRVCVMAAVAATSLFALGGVAQAQDPPAPDQTLPPSFQPPAPAPVTDVDSAEAFAEGYADRNAWRFLRTSPRRVRVIDADAACLENPAVALRFGCVFTLRALVIERSRGWWGHDNKYRASSRRGDDDRGHKRHRRFRIRQYGCLGLLTVIGGPTPQGILRNVECARIPRGDFTAPEPEPVA